MNLSCSLLQRQTGKAFIDWLCPASASLSLSSPLLWVEYSQTLQHSCAAHTTRSLFTAEQPVTLPGSHSRETLASDPVAMAMPPDVSLRSAAEVGAVTGCATLWRSNVGSEQGRDGQVEGLLFIFVEILQQTVEMLR